MGMVKDTLLDFVGTIYPDDYTRQDALQAKVMSGKPLSRREFARAQGSEIGRKFIELGWVKNAAKQPAKSRTEAGRSGAASRRQAEDRCG